MAETVLLPLPTTELASEPDHRVHLLGVLVMSFSASCWSSALTRLFSVILFYHFAFLAISIALLGLGAGGVFAYLAQGLAGALGHADLGRPGRPLTPCFCFPFWKSSCTFPSAWISPAEFPPADGPLSGFGAALFLYGTVFLGAVRAATGVITRSYAGRPAGARWPAWVWCRC